MTAREMQMEFERRITLMNPDFESKEKITSDTIFSFLNAYTERFVRNNYLQEDAVENGSRAQKKVIDSLKGLITRQRLTSKIIIESNLDNNSVSFVLPDDYFLYIRSNSDTGQVSESENTTNKPVKISYKNVVPNKIIKEDDVEKILTTKYNVPIIRHPYVIMHSGNPVSKEQHLLTEDLYKIQLETAAPILLENHKRENNQIYLTIIHDIYTNINSVDLVYCRKPKPFNIINADNINILDHCELPANVHMEIVEGAVEMFITEAKYRLNMKQN